MQKEDIKQFFKISNLIEGVDCENEIIDNVESFDYMKEGISSIEIMMFFCHSRLKYLNGYCEAGELRRYDVFVGNKACPPARTIRERLDRLFDWKPETWEQIKLWHTDFEEIHPFGDGNGRVGRFLMLIQLNKNKLEIPEIFLDEENFEENRQRYYKWFK